MYGVKATDTASPLHRAAKKGDVNEARELLQSRRYDVNCMDSLGQTPLFYASGEGHLEMVKMLVVNFQADISVQDNVDGHTAVMVAALGGHSRVVEVLLDACQASLEVKSMEGKTILHYACKRGHIDLVKILVSKYAADIDARDDENDSPLHVAAYCGKENVVLMLISEFGCKINSGRHGWTPLHAACCGGHVSLASNLVSNCLADINARDGDNDTPLHVSAYSGEEDVVLKLIFEFKCDVNSKGHLGRTPLHAACCNGHDNLAKNLISKCHADINARDDDNNTPLHVAAFYGKEGMVLMLVSELQYDVNSKGHLGRTPLHTACCNGHDNLAKKIISKCHADINARDDDNNTPLHVAALYGKEDVVLMLISEFKCDINSKGHLGRTPLHAACCNGHDNLAKNLISKCQADINARDDENNTPLHVAALYGKEDVVLMLISEFQYDVNSKGHLGRTPLHTACSNGLCNLAKNLISKFQADINVQDKYNKTPLHVAASYGREDLVLMLITETSCDLSLRGHLGRTLLHEACCGGNTSLVIKLISKYKADINARDNQNDTPLHAAASSGKEDMVLMLITEFKCDPNLCGANGKNVLHKTCIFNKVNLVCTLIHEYKADLNMRDSLSQTPFHVAASFGQTDVVLKLIDEFRCNINEKGYLGGTLLHAVCRRGHASLARILISKYKADMNARDDQNNTPLHVASSSGKEDVVLMLTEFECDYSLRGYLGRSVLHCACSGNIRTVQIIMSNLSTSVIQNEKDYEGNTPLHIAALNGKKDIVLALLDEFKCDPATKGHEDRSLLHSACLGGGNADLVLSICKHLSPLVVDSGGNTPLHIAARRGYSDCVTVLLSHGAHILARNNSSKTALDVATNKVRIMLDAHIELNKDRVFEVLLNFAKEEYPVPECIVRIFVVGNSGTGKSSLIKSLKRAGQFVRSESDDPPHTAGIIPSTYMSKQCGRILFYEFAGDPEYYDSSHASILKCLSSSKRGDNFLFILVDLRNDVFNIKRIISYWTSFIKNHFLNKCIVVGSHFDTLSGKQKSCDNFYTDCKAARQSIALSYFMLNCCELQSTADIENEIKSLSPCHKLSLQASILLGLLKRDFCDVVSCYIQRLLSHIAATGIDLPKKSHSLLPLLSELQDIGFLLIITSTDGDSAQVILNAPMLTSEVHQLLFSKKALKENSGDEYYFNIGIILKSRLKEILPKHITKDILIHLQYCHEIRCEDIHTFSQTSTSTDSTEQSYLFFPALCTAQRHEIMLWKEPSEVRYEQGWVALCGDGSDDYFPPRFLHVLLLRLVFMFNSKKDSVFSPDHSAFQTRCCQMWPTGVFLFMEPGVKCIVELVRDSKAVVVLVRSDNESPESLSNFNRAIGCAMKTQSDICNNIQTEFFLLDTTDESKYFISNHFNPLHMYRMTDVERILANPVGIETIFNIEETRQMEVSKLQKLFTQTSTSIETLYDDLKHLILRKDTLLVSPASRCDLPDLGLSVSLIIDTHLELQSPVNLTVCCLLAAPPLLLPEGKHAVSPAYLLHMETNLQIKFSLRIHHFVALHSDEDCSNMQFLSANCILKNTGSVYKFSEIEGAQGKFQYGNCTGELTVSKLGIFVVAAPSKLEENYLCSWRLLRTFQEKVDETYLEAILYCCFYHPVYEEVSDSTVAEVLGEKMRGKPLVKIAQITADNISLSTEENVECEEKFVKLSQISRKDIPLPLSKHDLPNFLQKISWKVFERLHNVVLCISGVDRMCRFQLSLPKLDSCYPGVEFFRSSVTEHLTAKEMTIDCLEDMGISVFIPEDSISPEDATSADFCIRPCTVPSKLPNGFEPASPAYLIEHGNVKFQKEVVIKICHFANLQSEEDCQEMKIFSASAVPNYEGADPTYNFKELESAKRIFKPGERVGKISLRHFNILQVLRKLKKMCRGSKFYSARLYRGVACRRQVSAMFCMCPDLPAYTKHCNQMAAKKYKGETSLESSLQFCENAVKVCSNDQTGFNVKFDKLYPQIRKEDVDRVSLSDPHYPPQVLVTTRIDSNFSSPELHVQGLNEKVGFALITEFILPDESIDGKETLSTSQGELAPEGPMKIEERIIPTATTTTTLGRNGNGQNNIESRQNTGRKLRKRVSPKDSNSEQVVPSISSSSSLPHKKARFWVVGAIVAVVAVALACFSSYSQHKHHHLQTQTCLNVDRDDLHAVEIKHLQHLTYVDARGKKKSLSIIREVSSKWRDIASLMGYEDDAEKIAASFNMNDRSYIDNCFRALMKTWLESEGTEEYPSSWNSLISILERIGKIKTANIVKKVLC